MTASQNMVAVHEIYIFFIVCIKVQLWTHFSSWFFNYNFIIRKLHASFHFLFDKKNMLTSDTSDLYFILSWIGLWIYLNNTRMFKLCWSLFVLTSVFYYQLDHSIEFSHSLNESANINAVWASLLVEECTRLGLTVRWW